MSRRLSAGVLVVSVVALSLVGVVAGASGAGAATPVKGGTFTFVTTNEPPTMSIAGAANFVGPTLFNVYDALVYERTEPGDAKTVPHLLKDLTVSPDATTWTFKLRPNVKFTDGTPFDSAALKANFDWTKDPANKSKQLTTASQVASWDISDPLVAKATLQAPNSAWDHLVNLMPFMASPAALAKYGADYGTSIDKIVGAGPFILKEWTRGSQMVFERNPNYWDAPRPYLDRVVVKFVADPTAANNTVITGGADAFIPPTKLLLDQAQAAGAKVLPYRPNAVSFRSIYLFNLQRAPFNDPIARQAMTMALDPKKVAAPRGAPTADNISNTDSIWYAKEGALPKYDPKKAQDLINQWSQKNGGKPLEFTVTDVIGSATLGGSGEVIQAVLSSYQNVKVNVEMITSGAVAGDRAPGQLRLVPLGDRRGGSVEQPRSELPDGCRWQLHQVLEPCVRRGVGRRPFHHGPESPGEGLRQGPSRDDQGLVPLVHAGRRVEPVVLGRQQQVGPGLQLRVLDGCRHEPALAQASQVT